MRGFLRCMPSLTAEGDAGNSNLLKTPDIAGGSSQSLCFDLHKRVCRYYK